MQLENRGNSCEFKKLVDFFFFSKIVQKMWHSFPSDSWLWAGHIVGLQQVLEKSEVLVAFRTTLYLHFPLIFAYVKHLYPPFGGQE